MKVRFQSLQPARLSRGLDHIAQHFTSIYVENHGWWCSDFDDGDHDGGDDVDYDDDDGDHDGGDDDDDNDDDDETEDHDSDDSEDHDDKDYHDLGVNIIHRHWACLGAPHPIYDH